MKDILNKVSKAIAGAIATALVGVLASNGIILDPETSNALSVVLTAVVGFCVVWLAPPNKS
jgi:hypothetical protein